MKKLFLANQLTLKLGDIVDIVATSSKCNPMTLGKMKEFLESWGLQCHIPEDLLGESLLYANSDEKRFEHLKRALLNNTSKAIWCLLGGCGATKLIPMLQKIKAPSHPKIFIGFSDITALHIFLQDQWGWSTIHGPSGHQAALGKVSIDSLDILKNMFFNKDKSLSYDEIIPLNSLAEKKTQINAPITGGNLHLIQASLGTSWQINTDNKILFIEEINERAYRVDRTFAHLNQAGVFDRALAILFGDFIDNGEPDGKFLVEEALKEFAVQCSLPVLKISHMGHGPVNNPLWLGSVAKLSMGTQYSLEFV